MKKKYLRLNKYRAAPLSSLNKLSEHFCPYCVQIFRALLRSCSNLEGISGIKSHFY